MSRAAVADRIDRPERIDRVAHALADGTRRGLLHLVRDDERAAGDLAAAFPNMTRPAVSQHLRVLSDAGLVTVRRDGNRRLYLANADGLTDVWEFIDGMWSDQLTRLKHAAERAETRRNQHGQPKRRTT